MKNLKEKIQKKFADAKGFTLIELIVVIAILGILTAIAVPTDTAYIDRAHEAADLTELDAIQTACYATFAEVDDVYSIEVTSDGSGAITGIDVVLTSNTSVGYDVYAATEGVDYDDDFIFYYTGDRSNTLADYLDDLTSDEYSGGATWENGGEWTGSSSGSSDSETEDEN